MLLQLFCAGEKQIQRFFGIFQSLNVSYEAARLDGEDKIGRSLSAPGLECLLAGQAVETVVDFNRIELLNEITEPLWRSECFWIELAIPPMFVIPTAGSDICLGHPFAT